MVSINSWLTTWETNVDTIKAETKSTLQSLHKPSVRRAVSKGIRVTVEDLETGEEQSREVFNDYVLVTAGNHCLSDTQIDFSSGTVTLTIKTGSVQESIND